MKRKPRRRDRRAKRQKRKAKMSSGNTFAGLYLKGPANARPSVGGSCHALYGYDAQGDLEIHVMPIQSGVGPDGHYIDLFQDVPPNLRASDYKNGFDPAQMNLDPVSNRITMKAESLTPKAVNDPASGTLISPGYDSGGRWVIAEVGGVVTYGNPPASVLTLPSETLTAMDEAVIARAKSLGMVWPK